MNAKQRIDYIDLAKGICILLVVSYHIDLGEFVYTDKHTSSFFFSFRMPLYYLLSGLFLSIPNENYGIFIQKKINRLIVPFVFFITITNIYSYIKHLFTHEEYIYSSPLLFLFRENSYGLINNPIWFLFSLFTTYLLYALLHYLFHGKFKYILGCTCLAGGGSFLLGKYHINLPFYLDSSLTCLPFVVTGVFLRKNTQLLYTEIPKWICVGSAFALFLFTYMLCGEEGSLFYMNSYGCNMFSLYATGLSGSLAILLICKAVKRLPVISYIGRYSVVVLGVHMIFCREFNILIKQITSSVIICESIVMCIVIALSLLSIAFFTKYFPCFVAQKDFVYFRTFDSHHK